MYHILFVDSEESHLKKVKKVLEAAPEEYCFYYTSTPEVALSVLEKEKVDVFICELELPVMSGEELFYLGSRVSPDTVQIALSPAKDIRKTMAAINRGGIFKLILKPCLLGDDIIVPVREAIKMRETLQNVQTEKGKKRRELEGRYYGLVDMIEEQKKEYGVILDMVSGLVGKNLELGMKSDPEKQSGKLQEYADEIQRSFASYFVFEPRVWAKSEKLWMQKFHHPNERRYVQIDNQMGETIPSALLPYLGYSVHLLLELVNAHLGAYQVTINVREVGGLMLLNFRCNLDASRDKNGRICYRIKNREEFEKIYRGTIHVLRLLAGKVQIDSKENPYAVYASYPL